MAEFLRKTGGAKPVFWNYEILRDMQTRKLFLFSPHLLHIIVIPPCKKKYPPNFKGISPKCIMPVCAPQFVNFSPDFYSVVVIFAKIYLENLLTSMLNYKTNR